MAKYFCIIIISLIPLAASAGEETIKEKFFGNISIKEVRSKENGKIDEKLVFQSFTNNLIPTDADVQQGMFVAWHPHYSKPILEITNKVVPITEKDCIKIDAPLCSKKRVKEYWGEGCNTSCLVGGPEFLAYDQNRKIVYFDVPTSFAGTAGQLYFVLSVNLTDTKVKLLMKKFNIHEASLSPSGRYLVLGGYTSIKIFDTYTGEKVDFNEKDVLSLGNKKLHYLTNIKWVNDTAFTYKVGIRHDKFQESYDAMEIVTYDVNQKMVINSRLLPKSEYNSEQKI